MAPATSDIASPCANVCEVDGATGLCRGCLRTLEEIAAWPQYSPAEKLEVLARLAARKLAGGGASRL